MKVEEKPSKITVDLGDHELHRQLKIAAIENDMTVREIVVEAVGFWLDHQELVENTLAREAIEYDKANPGGPQLTHDEVKARLAEQRA